MEINEIKENLKEFNIKISDKFLTLIKNNYDFLEEKLIEIEKERPNIDSTLLTTAYLESLRKETDVLLISNKEGFIEEIVYDKQMINLNRKFYIKTYDKLFFIEKDKDNNIKMNSYINGKIKKINLVKKIYSKYKDVKKVIFDDYNTLENFTDYEFKFLLSYLWGTRTEVGTTGIGCVIYDKEDKLITDGYNALKIEYNSKFLQQLIHCTYFLDIDKNVKNDKELVKEIYNLRESITDHSEKNAINYLNRKNIKLKNASIYLNFHPCEHCSKELYNYGIKKIVIDKNYLGNQESEQKNWKESIINSKKILKKGKIDLLEFSF